MNHLELIPLAVVFIAAATASITDFRQFRIPNWLTLPVLVAGLTYQLAVNGPAGLFASGVGALIGFAVLLPLYAVGGMGAGDLKLVAGVGAWLGPLATLEMLFAACLLTSLWSAVLLYRRKVDRSDETRQSKIRVEDVASRADRRTRLIPFGASVTAGLLIPLLRQWPY